MASRDNPRGSFTPGLLESLSYTREMLKSMRQLGEAKGKQELWLRQSPAVLETLKAVAVIQSTESSNRIEGVTAPPERIKELVERKTAPANRSEQEIAGYRDVLATIHANARDMPLTAGVVRQMHRDLFQFTAGGGGEWKPVNNEIEERLPDGTRHVRFVPVAAHLVPGAMDDLQGGLSREMAAETVDPIVVISAYVLDFLCIHPFRDGNGRMARLLSLLLLYQAGYEVGRWVSLEKIVEESRETYYESLYASSQGWHEGAHDLGPWLDYFLGLCVVAYRELEERVGTLTSSRGYRRQMITDCVRRLPDTFRVADVERVCPGVPRPTINRVLAELRDRGELTCPKRGRDAVWEKIGSQP